MALVAAGLAALVPYAPSRLDTHSGDFEEIQIGRTVRLHSMGVADFNSDGFLDVFTNNHAAAALFLQNKGKLLFEDRRLELGLSSNADFPGAELSMAAPAAQAGLNIFWHMGQLHVTSRGSSPEQPHALRLMLGSNVMVRPEGATSVDPRDAVIRPGKWLTLEFPGDGSVALSSLNWIIGGVVEMGGAIDLDTVRIGSLGISPTERRFALRSGTDRHGVAWTDLDADGRRDAIFIVGGASGKKTEPEPYPVVYGSERGFGAVAAVPGLDQELCPSRQVTLTDADGDGAEDIHVICGRGEPPRRDHPHEIFLRRGEVTFRNGMRALGLDLGGNGVAIWADLDDDGALDLVWADTHTIRIFRRDRGRFAEVFSAARAGEKSQIALGDIDGDLDTDVYVASTTGSLVVVNDAGVFRAVEPSLFGLPEAAACAVFVDYDLDGESELFTLPQGLAVRTADGGFRSDGLLAGASDFPPHCQWFDADNDGDRDLLVALPENRSLGRRLLRKASETVEHWRYAGSGRGRIFRPEVMDVVVYRNDAAANSWLAVDVVGPHQSPNGIGARIRVETPTGSAVRHVGHAEGSTTSAGHYRAYFGLGSADIVDAVTVTWPSGEQETVSSIAPNQVIVLHHGDCRPCQRLASTALRHWE